MSTYAALIWCGVWTGIALGLLAIVFLIYDGISFRSGRRKRPWQNRRVSIRHR